MPRTGSSGTAYGSVPTSARALSSVSGGPVRAYGPTMRPTVGAGAVDRWNARWASSAATSSAGWSFTDDLRSAVIGRVHVSLPITCTVEASDRKLGHGVRIRAHERASAVERERRSGQGVRPNDATHRGSGGGGPLERTLGELGRHLFRGLVFHGRFAFRCDGGRRRGRGPDALHLSGRRWRHGGGLRCGGRRERLRRRDVTAVLHYRPLPRQNA